MNKDELIAWYGKEGRIKDLIASDLCEHELHDGGCVKCGSGAAELAWQQKVVSFPGPIDMPAEQRRELKAGDLARLVEHRLDDQS